MSYRYHVKPENITKAWEFIDTLHPEFDNKIKIETIAAIQSIDYNGTTDHKSMKLIDFAVKNYELNQKLIINDIKQ